MKAIIYEEYGPPEVLQIKEVQKPIPQKNEILVKIYATTVTAECPKQRALAFPPLIKLPYRIMFGYNKPKKNKILGIELAGVIEDIGSDVTRFKIGDRVYGYTGLSFGAYAEYKCLVESSLIVQIPPSLSFEQAAVLPNSTMTAFAFLKKKGKIKSGEKVLIYGASGSVGTAAVQITKYFGAHVTAVCSTRNLDFVKSLGADKAIDYTTDDFTEQGEFYDIIFDTIGKSPRSNSWKILSPNGRYLLTEFGIGDIAKSLWTPLIGKKKLIIAASNLLWEISDLHFINKAIDEKKLNPVVDKIYPYTDIQEAHSYVETGRKRGNVVIRMA